MPPLVLTIEVDDKGSPVLREFADTTAKAGQRASEAFNAPNDAQGRFSQATQTATGHVTNFASSLGRAATAGVAFAAGLLGFQGVTALFREGSDSILSFSKELANVNTVLVGSSVSIRDLEKQILLLPPSLGSATELTKGLYQALSAGIEPAKAVAFIAEEAKLASAGLTNLSTTVKVSTAAMDAFGISATNASHISDVLFTIVQRGKVEFEPLATSIAQVFPLAKTLGISFEETAATVTTLTKVFPTAGESITGFRSLLSGVIAHLDDFKAAGIRVNEVIAQRGLTGLIQELARVTGQSAEVLRAKFVPDIEGTTAALALMGPQLQNQKDNVQAFTTVVGANAVAFDKQQVSIVAGLGRITASLEKALLGSGLEVFLTSLTKPLEAWIGQLTEGGKASVQFAQIVTLSLGVVSTGLGLLARGTLAVFDGWLRLGQGINQVAIGYFSVLEGMEEAAVKLGLVSRETADKVLVGYAKLKLPILENIIVLGEQAEKAEKTATSIKLGQEEVQKALSKAGAEAEKFARELGKSGEAGAKASADTVRAVQTIPPALAVLNAAIVAEKQEADAKQLASTKQTVDGTITVWRNGQQVQLEVFRAVAEGGTKAAGDTAAAFTKAGISTRETLQRLAQDALEQFTKILASGEATPEALLDQWQKVLRQISEAGFQTLPRDFAEINAQMQAIARKAGIELPAPYLDAFGKIIVGAKQFPNAFRDINAEVSRTTIQFGEGAAGLAKGLTAAQIETGVQFGLISRQAADTALAIQKAGREGGQGFAQGVEQGAQQAEASLRKVARLSELTLVGFTTKFGDTPRQLLEQLAEFRTTAANAVNIAFSQLAEGFTGESFDALVKQLRDNAEDAIFLIGQKLEALGFDITGRPLKADTGSTTTTPTGGTVTSIGGGGTSTAPGSSSVVIGGGGASQAPIAGPVPVSAAPFFPPAVPPGGGLPTITTRGGGSQENPVRPSIPGLPTGLFPSEGGVPTASAPPSLLGRFLSQQDPYAQTPAALERNIQMTRAEIAQGLQDGTLTLERYQYLRQELAEYQADLAAYRTQRPGVAPSGQTTTFAAPKLPPARTTTPPGAAGDEDYSRTGQTGGGTSAGSLSQPSLGGAAGFAPVTFPGSGGATTRGAVQINVNLNNGLVSRSGAQELTTALLPALREAIRQGGLIP